MLCLLFIVGCRHNAPPVTEAIQTPDQASQLVDRQFTSGDLRSAQGLAEESFRQYATADPRWAAVFGVQLARVYLYQGRSEKVVGLLRKPLLQNAPHDLIVRSDLLLAVAEARLGNSDRAQRALDDADALYPNAALRAETFGAKGSVALEEAHFDKAEQCFREALEGPLDQSTRFLETQMWLNLGVVALHLEHYDEALQNFHHASTLAESIGARLALEKSLGSLGWTYYQTGDYKHALQNAKTAGVQAAAIGATLDEVRLLTNAGMSQFKLNDLVSARVSYERSLGLAEGLRNSEEMLAAHLALAYLLLHDQPSIAAVHVHEAERLARLRHDPTEELEPMLLESFLLLQQGQDSAAESALLNLVKRARSSPSVQWVASDTLAGICSKERRERDAHRWYERAIATFHQQRLSLRSVELQLPFLENGSNLYLDYMEHLIHEGKTDEALRILDSSRAETLAEGLKTPSSVSDRLQAKFSSVRSLAERQQATILVYCLRPRASYLWAINSNRADFYTLTGSETILPLVGRHTQAILASKDLLSQQDSTGRQLYDALVRPAEGVIGKGRRVLLIADQGLGGLNFETLIPPGDKPHYWIEDVALTNARSLRLLGGAKVAAVSAAPRKLLLIGDPLYRADQFPPLPNARAEMTDVASHFKPELLSVSAGPNAAPARYASSNPARFTYIHFVAHATANDTNPLDSAIILSEPPNTPADRPEANRLYAREILEKPLDAELVTISSCYGSGTRNYSGEGVVGLVWAFLRAGSHAVIGAMWEVSDVSTPQLMDALYSRLLSGDRPDVALRSAKLTMLHGDSVFRKPLYWAAFQLYAGR